MFASSSLQSALKKIVYYNKSCLSEDEQASSPKTDEMFLSEPHKRSATV